MKSSQRSTMTNNLNLRSEQNLFKAEIPQIFAATAAALSDTCVGLALAFSAVLIPQVLQEQDSHSKNAIQISKEESTYIASLQMLLVIPSAFIGGFLMDALGRLAVLKIGAIPTLIGWILVAVSSNKWMLICGRCLSAMISGLFTTSIIVYITEISTPKYRGALLALGPLGVSLGMLMVYVIGACFHWRVFAWICVGYAIIPLILIMFLPESPPWLISKNRLDQAKKSLQWLKKYYFLPENEVENELSALLKEQRIKKEQEHHQASWRMILKPTVYKPFFVITGLFVIQQFSGSYIMLLYSVTFIENVGTKVNPYLASILIGGIRFGMSFATVWLLRYIKRRPLLFIGLGGMAVCMGISALYTNWILEGTTTYTWIPVVMLPLYILFAMLSVLSIPFTFTGELFPLAARGISQSILCATAHLLIFISLENYYTLNNIFGGASGLQYFFGIMSLFGVVYCYVFVPETHGKKLSELEEYFAQHSTYLSVNTKNKQSLENENLLKI